MKCDSPLIHILKRSLLTYLRNVHKGLRKKAQGLLRDPNSSDDGEGGARGESATEVSAHSKDGDTSA